MTDVITDRFSANDSFASEPLTGLAATGKAIEGEVLAKRYQIRSLLSSGGFGVTFLARNVYLPGQPLCIVKKLAPPLPIQNRSSELTSNSISKH